MLPCSLLAGTGKAIRGDEWAYHTPAILHQVYRATPFDSETTPLGPDHASLFSNLPVWHFTTIFRPQFWGFFIFAPDYAFSFYWQFKALLLLTGVFSLLLLLTQSSRVAAFGALWYAFSPNIQWTYSWPSLLPEMVGLFCLVMCAVFYMSIGRRPARLRRSCGGLRRLRRNFALCAYIPHQIPLVWLGVFLCIWWVVAKRKTIFTRDSRSRGSRHSARAWCVVGVVDVRLSTGMPRRFDDHGQHGVPGASVVARRRLFDPGAVLALLLPSGRAIAACPCPRFRQHLRVRRIFWLAPITLLAMRGVTGAVATKLAYWTLMTFGALLLDLDDVASAERHRTGSVHGQDRRRPV